MIVSFSVFFFPRELHICPFAQRRSVFFSHRCSFRTISFAHSHFSQFTSFTLSLSLPHPFFLSPIPSCSNRASHSSRVKGGLSEKVGRSSCEYALSIIVLMMRVSVCVYPLVRSTNFILVGSYCNQMLLLEHLYCGMHHWTSGFFVIQKSKCALLIFSFLAV